MWHTPSREAILSRRAVRHALAGLVGLVVSMALAHDALRSFVDFLVPASIRPSSAVTAVGILYTLHFAVAVATDTTGEAVRVPLTAAVFLVQAAARTGLAGRRAVADETVAAVVIGVARVVDALALHRLAGHEARDDDQQDGGVSLHAARATRTASSFDGCESE